jgi:hypothetical protein
MPHNLLSLPAILVKVATHPLEGIAAARRELPILCQRMLNIEYAAAERTEFELADDFVSGP